MKPNLFLSLLIYSIAFVVAGCVGLAVVIGLVVALIVWAGSEILKTIRSL